MWRARHRQDGGGSPAISGRRGVWQSPHSLPGPGLGWWWLLRAQRVSIPGSQERRLWRGTGHGGAESGGQGSGASSRRVEARPDRHRPLLRAWGPQGSGTSGAPAAEHRPPAAPSVPTSSASDRPRDQTRPQAAREAQPLGPDRHLFCPIKSSRSPARPSRLRLLELRTRQSGAGLWTLGL